MNLWAKAVLGVAGLVALAGATAAADPRLPVSLTSFGAVQSLTARPVLTSGPVATFSAGDFARIGLLPVGVAPQQSFASSLALSSSFALDGGYNIDVAQRFDNFDALKSPLLPVGDLLGLANGGRYMGATWALAPALSLRVGAAQKDNRLDRFSFDPVSESLGLPLAVDAGQSRTLMAGINWDVSDWGAIDLTGIQNSQSGTPYGVNPLGNLQSATQIDTSAVDMAAHLKLGHGWVTTASYAEGLTQLDQRAAASVQDINSYSFAIAKHGVFGDDAVGFSFSHPTPGVLGNGFEMPAASGDLPPMFVISSKVPEQTRETDLQLGYVTSFLDGALALQANAAYQMNYQGQAGATSLSVLSRARIKF